MKIRIVLIAMLAGSAFALPGCEFLEPKVESPFTGRPVNEAGLAREIVQQEAKAKAEAQAAADKAAAEIRAAQATARQTAIDLQQRQAVTAAEIQATAARVEAETGQKIADATATAAAAAKGLADRVAALNDQADAALAAIDAKKAQWGGILNAVASNPFVKGADGATGGAITGLLGLAGGFLARSVGSRKRHDATWDEATAKAQAEAAAAKAREDAAWDAAQAQLLALHAPPPPKAA